MTLSVCKHAAAAAFLLAATAAQAGVPYPTAATPAPVDLGLLRELAQQRGVGNCCPASARSRWGGSLDAAGEHAGRSAIP